MRSHDLRRLPRLLVLLVSLLLVVAAAGCGGGTSSGGGREATVGSWGGILDPGSAPKRGGTLRIDQRTAPQGISPLSFLSNPNNATIAVVMQVFDQLVELEPGSLDPRPGLATRWTISPNGLTYRFTLRDTAFSDGTPLAASDVAYTLQQLRKSVFADLFATVERVATPDPKTVVLTLSAPTPGMLSYLAFPGASILPEKLIRASGREAFDQRPVGTGAFVVKRWVRGQQVELTANPGYWRRGQPYLTGVKLASVPDDNTRVLNIKAGNSDVADSIPFSQIDPLSRSGSVDVLVAPGADMFVVGLNNSRKPLDEIAVRRALNLATPVDDILKVVFSGKAPAMNMAMPKLKYWAKDAKRLPFDLARAKRELAGSSVPNGFRLTLATAAGDQASRQAAQLLKTSWAKIGVELTIDAEDDATRDANYESGNYAATLSPPGSFTSDVTVDDQFATLLFNSKPTDNLFTFYRNPAAASLTRRATSTNDEGARTKLFAELQRVTNEDPPSVPLAYTPNRAAVGRRVHGYNYLLNGWSRLEDVWVEPGDQG